MNDETMRELIRQGRGPVDVAIEAGCPRFNTHDCLCPPEPPNPNCPAAVRDRRERDQMADAWNEGMAAFAQGLGSSDNPYRKWSR